MRTAKRSVVVLGSLGLSVATLILATSLGSTWLAALGALCLIVGLLALERVPRDRRW